MKIVAVIPARGGSKGIPNKNIRLLRGKPLIYYQIENAKRAKHITDIIVSSDSAETKLVAKQTDVYYKKQEDKLCRDETSLDEVVYAAVKDIDCDIVITMQPTSPTWTVETLDSAIE